MSEQSGNDNVVVSFATFQQRQAARGEAEQAPVTEVSASAETTIARLQYYLGDFQKTAQASPWALRHLHPETYTGLKIDLTYGLRYFPVTTASAEELEVLTDAVALCEACEVMADEPASGVFNTEPGIEFIKLMAPCGQKGQALIDHARQKTEAYVSIRPGQQAANAAPPEEPSR